MSDFKNIVKSGWHPKGKDGGKESWRGDFKGINQVAGWMGKSKQPGKAEGSEHISRPLASLKDPSSFGPPPRNVNYHGGVALPNQITPHTGGLGAPLSRTEIESANRAVHGPPPEEEEQKPAGPPVPYRADTTGLQTSHLPPPPVFRNHAASPEPVSNQPPKPKPGLPPRLPSRQNTGQAPVPISSPPPAYETTHTPQPAVTSATGGLNQSAINRLGKAGVSVPGFGIQSTSSAEPNPWKNEKSQQSTSTTPQSSQPALPNLSELQSRFARMTSNSAAPAPSTPSANASTNQYQQSTSPLPTPPLQSPPIQSQVQPQSSGQGQSTTWAQKQAALRTAQNMHSNPSQVTMSDAQTAAKTMNAFRERHSDSIAAAGAKANAWNKKYNVTGKINKYLEEQTSPVNEQPPNGGAVGAGGGGMVSPQHTQSQFQQTSPELAASISRKPPPPPPPKKPAGMHGNSTAAPPPPVPLGTKPGYS